jgi:hypothetical protein
MNKEYKNLHMAQDTSTMTYLGPFFWFLGRTALKTTLISCLKARRGGDIEGVEMAVIRRDHWTR